MKKAKLVVSLNPALDPPVIISNRKLDAEGRSIRWTRKKGETFTFKRLNGLDQAYFNKQSINKKRTRVSCGNRAPDGQDFTYEIVVTLNNAEYTSTKSGGPGGDKPVIRN